jgi:hypothetical protein
MFILRTILYQAKIAKDKEDIIRAIEAMCGDDMIAVIEKKVALHIEKEAKTNGNI